MKRLKGKGLPEPEIIVGGEKPKDDSLGTAILKGVVVASPFLLAYLAVRKRKKPVEMPWKEDKDLEKRMWELLEKKK